VQLTTGVTKSKRASKQSSTADTGRNLAEFTKQIWQLDVSVTNLAKSRSVDTAQIKVVTLVSDYGWVNSSSNEPISPGR